MFDPARGSGWVRFESVDTAPTTPWFMVTGITASTFTPQGTTFTPDIDGTYTVTTTASDTCPGADPSTRTVQTARTYSVQAKGPLCSQLGGAAGVTVASNITRSDPSVSVSPISATWKSKSLGFDDDWYYGGQPGAVATYEDFDVSDSAVATGLISCYPTPTTGSATERISALAGSTCLPST